MQIKDVGGVAPKFLIIHIGVCLWLKNGIKYNESCIYL